MYTLTISNNSKRRTLGYLTNDYYPGGKKDLGRIVNYKILGDDGEGFFKIGFPGMDRYEFEDVVKKLIQQGVSPKGADSQLTERIENKTMKLKDLVPLKEYNDGHANYMKREVDLDKMSDKEKADLWQRMTDDEKEEALLTIIKDPSEAAEYIENKWEDLPDQKNFMQGIKDYSDLSGSGRMARYLDQQQRKKMGYKLEPRFANMKFDEAKLEKEKFTKPDQMRMYKTEGSCGYAPEGEDPNKADKPAGPHLLRKEIRKQIKQMMESFADDPDVPGTTGMEDAGGKVRDNIASQIPDNYSYKDLAQDIAYIIQNDYGSHNAKPFIQMLTQKLQRPNY